MFCRTWFRLVLLGEVHEQSRAAARTPGPPRADGGQADRDRRRVIERGARLDLASGELADAREQLGHGGVARADGPQLGAAGAALALELDERGLARELTHHCEDQGHGARELVPARLHARERLEVERLGDQELAVGLERAAARVLEPVDDREQTVDALARGGELAARDLTARFLRRRVVQVRAVLALRDVREIRQRGGGGSRQSAACAPSSTSRSSAACSSSVPPRRFMNTTAIAEFSKVTAAAITTRLVGKVLGRAAGSGDGLRGARALLWRLPPARGRHDEPTGSSASPSASFYGAERDVRAERIGGAAAGPRAAPRPGSRRRAPRDPRPPGRRSSWTTSRRSRRDLRQRSKSGGPLGSLTNRLRQSRAGERSARSGVPPRPPMMRPIVERHRRRKRRRGRRGPCAARRSGCGAAEIEEVRLRRGAPPPTSKRTGVSSKVSSIRVPCELELIAWLSHRRSTRPSPVIELVDEPGTPRRLFRQRGRDALRAGSAPRRSRGRRARR